MDKPRGKGRGLETLSTKQLTAVSCTITLIVSVTAVAMIFAYYKRDLNNGKYIQPSVTQETAR